MKTDVPNEKADCRRERQTARAHRRSRVAGADGAILRGVGRRTEPILRAFNEKADGLHPDWRETVERSERGGVILRALFIHALNDARARPDLTEFERFQIKDLEAEFVTTFDTFSLDSPVVAERAFKLALVVQEMEMIARLGLEEAEKRKRRAMSEGGRKGGKKSGQTRSRENKPWYAHATELAQVYYSEFPDASDENIAVEIVSRWKLEETLPPGVRTLETFVADLRRDGKLPKRAK